ncbi:MAG: DNA photolyase [Desulfobacteraceae bacterium]|nr:DNA photolyase [Desulfobacteraceae bacterium]
MSIKHLYADPPLLRHQRVAEIADRLELTPQVLEDKSILFKLIKSSNDPWRKGKEILWLSNNKGAFIKPCPGTRDYLCCGYQILHFAAYCVMDCSYCILQSYFHPPVLRYFINHNDLFLELEQIFQKNSIVRIGTGEFTDSLMWENFSDLTPDLVHRFSSQQNAILELKTKTVNIKKLKLLPHNRKTILSWSLNTPQIISKQERATSSLDARFRAARQCSDWGYPLAFHFDPIFIYPGCEKEYKNVVKELFTHISPSNVVWISLGAFRFMPALQQVVKQRFSESDIVYGEFIPGLDGKMRYFKKLRMDMFKILVEQIKSICPDVLVYLCMEDEQVWNYCFGYSPDQKGGIAAMLDDSARRHCDLV